MEGNRICALLKIDHPILQGGMLWLADAGLAAAVSNAGALGVISPLAGMERHGDRLANLRLQMQRTRQLTAKPFGVNLPLDLQQSGEMVNLLLQEEVAIVVTAAGDPRNYTELFHQAQVKVLHVVSSVRQAKTAASCGVDGLIVEGIEAGGHDGFDEIPLLPLLPQVAEAVELPIVAAGGIANGRGFAAALALGAEGIQLGTRFVATEECIASPIYKKAILAAPDTGTVVTSRPLVPTRSLKTAFTQCLMELERSGASAQDIRGFLGYGRARTAQLEGDLENGEAYCGAAAGLIREILPAAEVIRRLVDECRETIEKLNTQTGRL